MKDETAIEQEIQAKGLNAPRLTPDMIDGTILTEQYWNPTGTTMTICVLTLRNGFNVTGESAAASPENFDESIGRKISRENARNKIWALEGYLLRDRLANGGLIEQHLFSFAGWLTSREDAVTFSSTHDAAPAALAVQEFIDRKMTSGGG